MNPNTDSQIDETRRQDMHDLLEAPTIILAQQILATDWESLSARELAERKSEMTERSIRRHLNALAERDRPFIAKLEAETRQHGIPWTYYAVTEYGIDLLKETDFYEPISLLYQAYKAAESTEEIQVIEEFEHRPTPDWL